MPEFTQPQVQLSGVAPEIILLATALVLLIVDTLIGERHSRWFLAAMATAGLVAAGGFAASTWGDNELQLSGAIALDGFASFVKVSLAVFGLLTVWVGRDYLRRDSLEDSEFYALVLFAVTGMMLMAAAADLIVMFLALETFSIALYVLVAFKSGSLTSQESAMKYFLLGAFSSAFFLLGIALTYGAVGTTALYGGSDPVTEPGIASFLSTSPAAGAGLLVLATGF